MDHESEIEELKNRLDLASEAIQRIWGVVDDLLNAVEIDREEYEDDLARINQLGHLMM